jgi:hypothetical protein
MEPLLMERKYNATRRIIGVHVRLPDSRAALGPHLQCDWEGNSEATVLAS